MDTLTVSSLSTLYVSQPLLYPCVRASTYRVRPYWTSLIQMSMKYRVIKMTTRISCPCRDGSREEERRTPVVWLFPDPTCL